MAPKTKKGSKKGKRRAGMRSKRSPRTVPEKASLTATRQFTLLSTNQAYRMYDVELSHYLRAIDVAKAYQLYRIKNCKLVLSPLADTFAAGGGTSVPYAYFQIDRTRDLSNVRTAIELKRLGCKPRRVDDNIITFEWKPSVLNLTQDSSIGPGIFNQYKMSPWLRTRKEDANLGLWNPDTTDHQGVVFFVENSGGAEINYKMELVVEFEFKKPSTPAVLTEGFVEAVDLNTLAQEVS